MDVSKEDLQEMIEEVNNKENKNILVFKSLKFLNKKKNQVDDNGDGEIQFEEFYKMWSKKLNK